MSVMKRAWEIAKEAQSKFGGKVKEYFRLSLIQAWSEHKQPKNMTTTLQGSEKQVAWATKIKNDLISKWNKDQLALNFGTDLNIKELFLKAVEAETNASYFISHRCDLLTAFMLKIETTIPADLNVTTLKNPKYIGVAEDGARIVLDIWQPSTFTNMEHHNTRYTEYYQLEEDGPQLQMA